MNEPHSTRPRNSLSPILSEQAEALRRQAEIDLEVTMREHRYELDQILVRQKAVLRALLFTVIAFVALAGMLFLWLRHGDTEELQLRKAEAGREVAELRKRNEEAQALVESFRELERAWKRRLIEAAGARPQDEYMSDLPVAPPGTSGSQNGAAKEGTQADTATPSDVPPVYGPLPEPAPKADSSKPAGLKAEPKSDRSKAVKP